MKPSLVEFETIHKSNLEPTYEELKLVYGSEDSVGLVDLEPTYEELKQTHNREVAELRWAFRAYLRGIETHGASGPHILEV